MRSDQPTGRNPLPPPEPIGVASDEIYERYLARAITEVNALGDEITRRSAPPDQRPVLGSGHPLGDIFLLKHRPVAAELAEGVSFYGRLGDAVLKSVQRLDIDPLLVYGTNCVKFGGGHGRDEDELQQVVYPGWLLRELQIVQPKVVVVMGDDALEMLGRVELPLSRPIEATTGAVQKLTPTIDALYTPPIEDSLDDQGAKRRFWDAFRSLGEWYAALPPY